MRLQEDLQQEFPSGHIEILRWGRIMGLHLPSGHRTVLWALCCFADLQGRAWPSQDTLAWHVGKTRQTVNALLGEIESLGGYFTSRLSRRGQAWEKEYFLAGVETGWAATIPDPDDVEVGRPVPAQLRDVVEAQRKEIVALRELVLRLGGDPYLSVGLSDTEKPDTQARARQEDEDTRAEYMKDVWAFSEAHWKDAGWNDPGAAIAIYSKDPVAFESAKRAQALRDRAGEALARVEPPTVSGDPDPAAVERWESAKRRVWQTLNAMKRELLGPTSGHAIGEGRMVVACPSRINIEWLEGERDLFERLVNVDRGDKVVLVFALEEGDDG